MEFGHSLKLSQKAYVKTYRKISFLIPLLSVWGNTAWWFGFIKGHIDGYGHGKRV